MIRCANFWYDELQIIAEHFAFCCAQDTFDLPKIPQHKDPWAQSGSYPYPNVRLDQLQRRIVTLKKTAVPLGRGTYAYQTYKEVQCFPPVAQWERARIRTERYNASPQMKRTTKFNNVKQFSSEDWFRTPHPCMFPGIPFQYPLYHAPHFPREHRRRYHPGLWWADCTLRPVA